MNCIMKFDIATSYEITLLNNIGKALKLLGWRGGCTCNLWRDGKEIVICLDNHGKKPKKRVLKKIKDLFGFDKAEHIKGCEDTHKDGNVYITKKIN